MKVTNTKTEQVCEFDTPEAVQEFMRAVDDAENWLIEGGAAQEGTESEPVAVVETGGQTDAETPQTGADA